jgi:N-acetylmuramic acid 6-phosphate etherase
MAITEGGETSSVLGTVMESADRGAKVFLAFNNPAVLLAAHIERSRIAIEDPRVVCLDLHCGPMGLAGSTRMQATTSEQLIVGVGLELILNNCLKSMLTPDEVQKLGITSIDYTVAFSSLLSTLASEENIQVLEDYIKLEKSIYDAKGLITYYGNEYLLDIFTDTTERAPTFMTPPFIKKDDYKSPPSWAFVKNPVFSTKDTWHHTLGRIPRCLNWKAVDYRQLGASETIINNPPILDGKEIEKFAIGNETDALRYSRIPNLSVSIQCNGDVESDLFTDFQEAYSMQSKVFQKSTSLFIGDKLPTVSGQFRIGYSPICSSLNIMEHMAIKLVLNLVSTSTMVLMGRVTDNWMSWVEVSNKKLKDRGIRLIAEIGNLSYEEACYQLHESIAELSTISRKGERISPVQYTIQKFVRHEN